MILNFWGKISIEKSYNFFQADRSHIPVCSFLRKVGKGKEKLDGKPYTRSEAKFRKRKFGDQIQKTQIVDYMS